jgi:hypothetical protein
MPLGSCATCGNPIPGDEGVILVTGGKPSYERFYEDLRTSGYDAEHHPVCWGETHGVRALVEVIHRRDVIDSGRVDPPDIANPS